MRKVLLLAMLCPLFAIAQYTDQSKTTGQQPAKPASKPDKPAKSRLGIGIKGGVNYANVSSTSSIKASNKTGFMAGAFMTMGASGLINRRMELIYSKQGYNFQTNNNTGTVDMDYIFMPVLVGINIGKFALIQAGPQTAFLLNAKADSSSNQSDSNPYANMMPHSNRVTMGGAAGIEIYPFKGLLIGARYNLSFGDMYKQNADPGSPMPSFLSDFNAKNNVVQFFIGYTF